MPWKLLCKQMSVSKTFRLLAPIVAAALFLLTLLLTHRSTDKASQALHSTSNCRCSYNSNDSSEPNGARGSRLSQFSDSPQLQFNRTIRLPSVCLNETCKSAYIKHLQSRDIYPIPEIRHILWKNESVSTYFAEQLQTWQRIHPNWTVVLWRDQDMDIFVATHFPGVLTKFKSLTHVIMKVDMIRYMLLYKYGGVYADLDYSLTRSLDEVRRFHAVVTREPDAHSLQTMHMNWPVTALANPAFLMSAPGHTFYNYVIQQLHSKRFAPNDALNFAGPFGLTEILASYQKLFPIANHAMETVYVPPSFSFYPYEGNRLKSSKSAYLGWRIGELRNKCHSLSRNAAIQLRQYCTDVNNLDPITDKSQPVFAVHDLKKAHASYDGGEAKYYLEKLIDIRRVIKEVKFGGDFI